MIGLSNPDTCVRVFLLNIAKIVPCSQVVTLPMYSQGYEVLYCCFILRQYLPSANTFTKTVPSSSASISCHSSATRFTGCVSLFMIRDFASLVTKHEPAWHIVKCEYACSWRGSPSPLLAWYTLRLAPSYVTWCFGVMCFVIFIYYWHILPLACIPLSYVYVTHLHGLCAIFFYKQTKLWSAVWINHNV